VAVARLIEGFLGAALLLAAVAKTADLGATGATLARVGLRPGLARPVVAVEAAVAAALLLGVAPAAAGAAALALGLAFVVVHLRAGETEDCGCLGLFDRRLPPRVGLARAVVFLAGAVAVYGLRAASGTLGLELQPDRMLLAAAGAALAVAALAVTGSILVSRRRLIQPA
jgi:hypothetical protein